MFEDSCHGAAGSRNRDERTTANLGPQPGEVDIPLAALANNMLNVRLESWLALNYVEMPVSEPNLRENFIDAVDIAKVECEHVSMMLYVDGLSVCKRLALRQIWDCVRAVVCKIPCQLKQRIGGRDIP